MPNASRMIGHLSPLVTVKGYLRRRIRRHVYVDAHNEADYERQELAIPVPVSRSSETVLTDYLHEASSSSGMPVCSFIPVYDPTYHSSAAESTASSLPPLQDHDDPDEENLRFWLVSHTSMWAGQDAMVDEVTGIVGCLVSCMDSASKREILVPCRSYIVRSLLRHFARRLVCRDFEVNTTPPTTLQRIKNMKKRLFQSWTGELEILEDVVEDEEEDEEVWRFPEEQDDSGRLAGRGCCSGELLVAFRVRLLQCIMHPLGVGK